MKPTSATLPARPAHGDPVLDALREIRDELRGLRAELGRTRQRPSRRGLLAALALGFGDRVFTCVDVLHLAASVPTLSAALDAAHVVSPRQLGIALAKFEGRDVDGLTVRRAGDDRHRVVWHIVRV